MPATYDLSFTCEFAFTDLPYAERVKVISDAGFLVDFGFATEENIGIFRDPQIRTGSFVATTAGSMLHPDDVEAFVDGVAKAIDIAGQIGSVKTWFY